MFPTTHDIKMSCNPIYNPQDKSNYYTTEDNNNNLQLNPLSGGSVSLTNNNEDFTYNDNEMNSMKLDLKNIYKPQLDNRTIYNIGPKTKSSSSSSSSIVSRKTDISSIYSLPIYNTSNSKLSLNRYMATISTINTNNNDISPYTFKDHLVSHSAIPKLAKRPPLVRNHSLSLSIKTHNLSTNTRSRSKTLTATTIKTPVSITSNNNLYSTNITNSDDNKTAWFLPGMPFNDISSEDDNNCNNGIDIPSPLQEELPIYHHSVYQNGPIQVISPNIFLYSEPTLNDILKFDVVINVAEEVESLETRIPNDIKQSIEYRHIKWSHDSKIARELNHITNVIHEASNSGMRVLVHCQCGVSRSASLIVAYIMRYDKLHLNEAYNKLKLIAKDISPNMGLIFQLMEWDEILNNKE